MELYLQIAILAVLVVGIALIYRQTSKKSGSKDEQSLLMLQNQMNDMKRTLDERLGEQGKSVSDALHKQHETLQKQIGESMKAIKDVTKELTEVKESGKRVESFADQLKNLQDILKNPKQRGVLGEYYLETVLKNVLPPGQYEIQYGFNDGTIVDAIVKTREGMVPIDSKFSLENYNRLLDNPTDEERKKLETAFKNDLKKRIDETSKYIKPDEGTTEFAMMFIPAEAIYYDLLVNDIGAAGISARDLVDYAVGEKKVIIVSPTTFLAYLQTVLQGLKALRIEEGAKEIQKRVQDLSRHWKAYEEYFTKVGNHLETTVNMYNRAYKEFGKLDKDVLRITDESMDVEVQSLPKPSAHKED